MNKRIIAIFILFFICGFFKMLLSQNASSINKELHLSNISDIKNPEANVDQYLINNNIAKESELNLEKMYKFSNISNEKISNNFDNAAINEYHFKVSHATKKPEKPTFNIVSSFRENIRFGGFWGRYAIINFTPSVNIQPFDFINIYANQNLSCFVPFTGIKEHFKSLCIQGAAILAVDNTIKFLSGKNKIIHSLIGFAAKNIVLSLIMGSINNKGDNKIYSYKSYYYSMNIRF